MAGNGNEGANPRHVPRPLARFLAQETAAAAVLLAAVVVALVWANSPWADGYHGLWEREIELNLGGWHPLVVNGHAMTFESFVGDALMVIFFFVVGLELSLIHI